MNEFVCQSRSNCKKVIHVDDLLLDAGPSVSSCTSLSELQLKLKEIEDQHTAEVAISSANNINTKPKNENRDNEGLFGSFTPAKSLTSFFRMGRKDVSLPSLESLNVNGGGNGIISVSPVSYPSSPGANSTNNNLNDSSSTPPSNSSIINYTTQEKSVATRLMFEFISDETRIDHPLCRECAVKINRNVNREITRNKVALDSYEENWKEMEKALEEKSLLSEEELENQIKAMEEEEKQLLEQLKQIENERKVLREEEKFIREEKEKIEGIEESYFRHYARFQQENQDYIDDNESIHMRLQNGTEELKRVRDTNIYNDTFHIWYDGHFGTINNFRLGRLPSQPVDWNEINAAWGQATLLLYTIAKKMNFKFDLYRLLPMGSSSKMEKISDGTHFELFGSSDISLGRLFWYRRFDNGMAAFLTCMAQIGDYAESLDKTFKLPYRIEKEKIGEMSIKLQFNNEETWTKSLKYLLTDLKFLLVFASKKIKTS